MSPAGILLSRRILTLQLQRTRMILSSATFAIMVGDAVAQLRFGSGFIWHRIMVAALTSFRLALRRHAFALFAHRARRRSHKISYYLFLLGHFF